MKESPLTDSLLPKGQGEETLGQPGKLPGMERARAEYLGPGRRRREICGGPHLS